MAKKHSITLSTVFLNVQATKDAHTCVISLLCSDADVGGFDSQPKKK